MPLIARMTILGRESVRRPIEMDGTVRAAGVPFDATITDLSAGGFSAVIDVDLSPGDEIAVGTPSLGVRTASVVWRDGSRYGFRFVAPISATDVAEAAAIDTVADIFGPAEDVLSSPDVGKPYPEPDIPKWPLPVRALIAVIASMALWIGIWKLLRRLATLWLAT